jgi:hypothetical protein
MQKGNKNIYFSFNQKGFTQKLKGFYYLKISVKKGGKTVTAEGNKLEDFIETVRGEDYQIVDYVLSPEGIIRDFLMDFLYGDWTGDEDFFFVLRHYLNTDLRFITYSFGRNMVQFNKDNVDQLTSQLLEMDPFVFSHMNSDFNN